MSSSVFLGSTFSDLIEHRRAVLYVIQRMHGLIEAMEYFGSESDLPLKVCLDAVDRSDLYIGLFGMRYGSTDELGVSITEREYERALSGKKTLHIYLLDEDRHLLTPAQVEQGEGAQRLYDLKILLRSRHVCTRFESPADLAGKVALDLVRYLKPKHEVIVEIESLVTRMPKLLLQAGYGIGLHPLTTTQDEDIFIDQEGHTRFADPRVQQAVSAGFIAAALSRGDFNVLKGTLTFDREFLDLIIVLLSVWGVDHNAVAASIRSTNDPMKFRLLTTISGRLGITESAEAICEGMLNRYFMHLHFKQLGQIATPIRDVVKIALTSMPKDITPIVERYTIRAKELRKWQQKQLFEEVLSLLLAESKRTDA